MNMILMSINEINVEPALLCIFPDMVHDLISVGMSYKRKATFGSPNTMNKITYIGHTPSAFTYIDAFCTTIWRPD